MPQEKEKLEELLEIHKRRLHELKKQQARGGWSTSPEISMEIEAIEAKIQVLQAELEALKAGESPTGPDILNRIEAIEVKINQLQRKLESTEPPPPPGSLPQIVPSPDITLTDQEKTVLQSDSRQARIANINSSGESVEWNIVAIRKKLNIFDGGELDTFCLTHFPEVYDKFSDGMRRDNKITLLLDYCRKTSERQQTLLEKLSEEFPKDPQIHAWLDTARRVSSPLPSPPPLETPSHLPGKTYQNLVGRSDELGKLMSVLRNPQSKPIVAVIGMGGIGKTALAREVAERCESEKLFNHIVWVNYKAEHFRSGDIVKTEVSDYSFIELLNDIGRQCNHLDIAKMPLEQKSAAVRYLLTSQRVLLVLDNLDTVPDSEKLVAAIFQILGQSKVLITSRHHLWDERVFTLDLTGFPEDEGVTFLRETSQERNIQTVVQASRPQLLQIHQVTGGAPLAMKLVIGQMSYKPMDVVLDDLKQAHFKGQDYVFYWFVFRHSWEILDLDAQMALVDMSVFPPITGGSAADVQAISQVASANFWEAMAQLVTLSLVDKTGPAGQERYALHPLTQYFICSDITKEWGAP